LPSDPVQNRQGNELTFPIDLTRAAYINFFGDFVVLSADWRQYTLLREALPGLMETEGEALLSGVFDLERAPRSLSRNLEGLAPPSLPLKVGWDEGLEGLDLLIGSIKKANVTLGWDVAQSAYQ